MMPEVATDVFTTREIFSFQYFTRIRRKQTLCGIVLALICLFGTLSSVAVAQKLTTETLIGKAVSDLGPKYKDVDEAITQFTKGNANGARQFLVIAKQKNPKLPPVDVLMAKLYLASRNGAQAQLMLEKATTTAPKDPEAYIMLGEQAYAKNRLAEADALFTISQGLLDSFSENAKRKRNFKINVFAGKAAVAERRGDYKTAVTYLKKWAAEDPENASPHQRLGRALFNQAETPEAYKAARVELAKSYALNNDLPNPDVTLGILFHQKDDEENARKAFMSAVKNDPNNAATLKAYGQWLLELGNSAEAQAPLSMALKLEPESIDTLILNGVTAKMNGNADLGEKYLLKAHDLAPANRTAMDQLAILLITKEDKLSKSRALQFARINAQLNSKDGNVLATLGWITYQLGNKRDANTAFQRAINSGGKLSADSTYFLAKAQFDQNQITNAKKFLESATKRKGIFVHRKQANELLRVVSGSPTPAGS